MVPGETIEQFAAAGRLPRAKPDRQLNPPPASLAPGARVAVLIPCCNEDVAVGKVVGDFHASLPQAAVYVYDNNSSDRTAIAARAAGAVVRHEPMQGKGHVVRRMFADVEADIYLLVDGDDTYDAAAAPAMLNLLLDRQLDMVTAVRRVTSGAATRPGHRLGNRVLTAMVRGVFGGRITDMLSGYRVFSRRFVKSFPAEAAGFETETEFTVHALSLGVPIGEIVTAYRTRSAGSQSKLRTWSDGLRILRTILLLVKEGRPLPFFLVAAGALLAGGLQSGEPVVLEFLRTGLVLELPSAVLAIGLVLLASLALVCGLVLDSVERGRRETKRLAYLSIPPIASPDA